MPSSGRPPKRTAQISPPGRVQGRGPATASLDGPYYHPETGRRLVQEYPPIPPMPDPRLYGDGSFANPYKSPAIAEQAFRARTGLDTGPGIFAPEARKGRLLDMASKALLDHVSQVEPDLDAWTGGPDGRNATNLARLLRTPIVQPGSTMPPPR